MLSPFWDRGKTQEHVPKISGVRSRCIAWFVAMAVWVASGAAALTVHDAWADDPTEPQPLEELYYFPENSEEAEVFLEHPVRLRIAQKTLYVCDSQASAIFAFARDGTFRQQIGREGEGPGEFYLPSGCYVDNEGRLYVDDSGNRRIQVFTEEGEHVATYRHPPELPSRVAVRGDTLYGSTVHRAAQEVLGQEGIISMYEVGEQELRRLRSFGKPFDFAPDNVALRTAEGYREIHDGRLYYLSWYYPVFRIYELDGELVSEVELDGRAYEDRVPGNYEWDRLQEGQRAFPFSYLFRTLDVNERGIFVGVDDDERLLIDHYDHEGNFIESYERAASNDHYRLHDVRVEVGEESALTIYALEENPYPRVTVLRPEER